MGEATRIYLDNAATSWPKPEPVYQAVEHFQRQVGAAPGRGSYAAALEAGSLVERARTAAARLIGAKTSRQISFGLNCTWALNQALWGFLRPGDHVVTSQAEHNSILRPLNHLMHSRGLEVSFADCDGQGRISVDDLARKLRPGTRLVAVTHASNVLGTIQPLEEIATLARERGARLLVDAAQSAGHLPIDVGRLPIDLLAASGHKGLLGPLGTGLLYVSPEIESEVEPLLQGGTGSASESPRQPDALPDRFEAGNLNAPGLAGLAAGLEYLAERGVEAVRQHEIGLTARLLDELRSLPGTEVPGPENPDERVGVVSLGTAAYDPQELSVVLDGVFGIQARAGLHCAPRMHERLGTLTRGGLLRLSVGPLSTEEQVDAAAAAIRQALVGQVGR